LTALANPCDKALAEWCKRWPLDTAAHLTAPIAVAYSGGADSTALLLAAAKRWPTRVMALHVHHGLQAAADDFERHALTFCGALGVALEVAHVQASNASGESPEDAARKARYTALSEMAKRVGADCVLLGQHADDQAETLMLALSRGAGLPGLAAMAGRFERHGTVFGRPLLGVPAQSLREWLTNHGQTFVEDPTNTDERFTRNRIRARLLPAWAETFPGFRAAMARTARHAAQAQTLLDQLADMDLSSVGAPPRIAALQALPPERQVNALRRWMKEGSNVAASEAQMLALLVQIDACRTRGHSIHIKVANGHIDRDGDRLAFTPPI
jgi:tRNA(Ile)-lysidine synthase